MKINRVYSKNKTPIKELMWGDVFVDPDSETQEVWMIVDFPSNDDTHMAVSLCSGSMLEFDYHQTVWVCDAELNINMR